jgi:hypothetical protein
VEQRDDGAFARFEDPFGHPFFLHELVAEMANRPAGR